MQKKIWQFFVKLLSDLESDIVQCYDICIYTFILIPRSFAPSWFGYRQSHRLLPSTSWSYTSIVLSWCFIVRLLRIVTVYKSLLLFSTPSFIFISMTFISPVLVQIVRGSKSFVATLIIANIDSFIVFWSILVVKYTIMSFACSFGSKCSQTVWLFTPLGRAITDIRIWFYLLQSIFFELLSLGQVCYEMSRMIGIWFRFIPISSIGFLVWKMYLVMKLCWKFNSIIELITGIASIVRWTSSQIYLMLPDISMIVGKFPFCIELSFLLSVELISVLAGGCSLVKFLI